MKKIIRLLSLILIVSLLCTGAPSAAYENGYVGGMAGSGEGILAHGLDISEWQGENVDFTKLREQGYTFVILRAGFSTTEDACFEENYTRAKAAGLHVGAYHYSYAATVAEAESEAAACLSWLDGKTLEYPVYYDIEDPEVHAAMSAEALTQLAQTFLRALSEHGWLCGVYSSLSWLNGKLDMQTLGAEYECWMAQYLYDGTYSIYDRYDEVYGIWQYSSSGDVEGVDGLVDLNIAFKDYPSICRTYGFNGYASQTAGVSIGGDSATNVLAEGEPMPVTGTVRSSQGILNSVTVGLFDAEGTQVVGKTVTVNAQSLVLSERFADLTTAHLPCGSYYYRVIVEDEQGTTRLVNRSVVISASGARLDGASVPHDLTVDSDFTIDGTITSAYTIKNITVGIYTAQGKAKLERTDTPNAKGYDLASFRNALPFSTLETGDYEYRVTVKTEKGKQTLLTAAFSVWVKNDPITLSGLNLRGSYLPKELQYLTGTVESTDSALKSVTVTVENAAGETVLSQQTNVNKKSASLQEISPPLAQLSAGSYRCRVEAVNAAEPTELYSGAFTVLSDEVALYGGELPQLLLCGESFCLSGTVTSEQSDLSAVSVTVTTMRGTVALSAASTASGRAFALDTFRNQLSFSALEVGEYFLTVRAENASGTSAVYEGALYVRSEADWVRWKGSYFAPEGRTYSLGESPTVGGMLMSDSEISEVIVEITNDDGLVVMDARLYPDATQVSLTAVNHRLRFAALPVGTYRYRVAAVNAAGEFTLLYDTFSYADCRHSAEPSQNKIAATCTECAVALATRCADCGGKLDGGAVGSRRAHTFSGGVCDNCGSRAEVSVAVRESTGQPTAGKQYVLAVRQGTHLYALGTDGQTVSLADDPTTVPAGVLWKAVRKTVGGVDGIALVARDGAALHLDADALRICAGGANTLLSFDCSESVVTVSSATEPSRAIGFDGKGFCIGEAELCIFETIYETSDIFCE